MSLLVELRNLRIDSADRTLIHNVNVDIRPQRVTALCGPSGSGKSLTARAIMGVLDVDPGIQEGSLRYPLLDAKKDWFEGIRKQGMNAQRRLLEESRVLRGSYFTYSPQSASSALNPGRTIGRQLELAIMRREKQPENMGFEIAKKLAEVDLRPSVAGSLPSELSGGMAQRAALAIAVAPQPKLVIADEPETGLDPLLRRGVIELLVRVVRQNGAGLLLISHHEETVDRIADDVIRLPKGRKEHV
jgi:ABC-type glutathione transport system ATPase component